MAKEVFSYAVKIKYDAGSTIPGVYDHYSAVKYFNTEDSAKKFIKETKTLRSKERISAITLYAKRNSSWIAIYGLGYSLSIGKLIELENLDNKVYNEIKIEKKLSFLKKIGITILSFIITFTQFAFMIIINKDFGIANIASLNSISSILVTFCLIIIAGLYYKTLYDYFQGKQKIGRTLLIILEIMVLGSL